MTISTETRIAGPYSGTGLVDTFAFSFKVFEDSDLFVIETDETSLVETDLDLTTDYTVVLNDDQDTNPGGSVVLNDPLASGKSLTIMSLVAYTQPMNLINAGGFYPSVINAALDRSTIQIQQIKGLADRCLKIPASTTGVDVDLPAPEADSLIGWNSSGTALRNWNIEAADWDDLLHKPFLDTSFDVDVNTTITTPIEILHGGKFNVADGVTLTISGPLRAPIEQIFYCTGSGCVRFTNNRSIDGVYPQWFGAVANGVIDCADAINEAIKSLDGKGGNILFPAGIYSIESSIDMTERNNVMLVGRGRPGLVTTGSQALLNGSILKWAGAVSSTMLTLLNAQHSGLYGLGFDGDSIDSCTAILIDSDNTPASRRILLSNFAIINMGTGEAGNGVGIRLGTSGTTGYESDFNTICDFEIRFVGTAIHLNSTNAQDGGIIRDGLIMNFNIGLHLYRGGWFNVKNLGIVKYQGANAAGIKIDNSGLFYFDTVDCQADEVTSPDPGYGVWITAGAHTLPNKFVNCLISGRRALQIDASCALSTELCVFSNTDEGEDPSESIIELASTAIRWISTHDTFYEYGSGSAVAVAMSTALNWNPGTNSEIVEFGSETGLKFHGIGRIDFPTRFSSYSGILVDGTRRLKLSDTTLSWDGQEGTPATNPNIEVRNGTVQSWNYISTALSAVMFGSGSNHPLNFITNGTARWQINTSGVLGDAGGAGFIAGASPANLNASAVLQANSTTKGFLPPRMTTAQRTAISSPAEGLTVFDTDLNVLCTYTGAKWQFTVTGAAAAISDGGTIAHGMGINPASVQLTGSVAGEMVAATAVDGTNITVGIKKHDGTDGTAQTIYWSATA